MPGNVVQLQFYGPVGVREITLACCRAYSTSVGASTSVATSARYWPRGCTMPPPGGCSCSSLNSTSRRSCPHRRWRSWSRTGCGASTSNEWGKRGLLCAVCGLLCVYPDLLCDPAKPDLILKTVLSYERFRRRFGCGSGSRSGVPHGSASSSSSNNSLASSISISGSASTR
jgi:hypothetical protein